MEPSNWDSLPDSIQNGATVQDTFFVDYVRVYKKIATDVESNDPDIPSSFVLSQNYPNPFNPSTTISYSLPQSGFVQLKVYDMLGREVTTLVNKEQTSGNYKIEFNASNLTSGVYFYRLQSGSFAETKKLIFLRYTNN